MESKKFINEDIEFTWKIHTPMFLKEIVDNGLRERMGVFFTPLNLFQRKLYELAELSQKINDPRLHLWFCEMTLYEQADPYSKDYDSEIFNKLKAEIKKLENGKKIQKN